MLNRGSSLQCEQRRMLLKETEAYGVNRGEGVLNRDGSLWCEQWARGCEHGAGMQNIL